MTRNYLLSLDDVIGLIVTRRKWRQFNFSVHVKNNHIDFEHEGPMRM